MPCLAALLTALVTSAPTPSVEYTLRVDPADLSAMHVELRVRDAPDTFRLAMAAHPEYDDRYWRFVEGARVEPNGGGAGSIVRGDSALWRVVAPGGRAVVRYRVRLPAEEGGQRASWRPFLAPTGGLVGGPHAFMYLLGAEASPSPVTFDLPNGWAVATALDSTADRRTFRARDVEALVESPALVGRLRGWQFVTGGVPHRVVYWPRPDAAPFDTLAFVGGVERLAREAFALFGGAPYERFTFLFQDGAYGGLEHATSVTLGAPSEALARDPAAVLPETAHEFVHTWNLVRLRPAERGGVDYRPARPTPLLWWSEGATMYYADLLPRRAGLPGEDSTRVAHLETLLARYHGNAGNSRVSPERSSLFEYGSTPGALGDYDPSPHVQGELVSTLLDLLVRDGSGGRRSLDDVMRQLLARHGGRPGFAGRDVERAVAELCACDPAPLFGAHVRGDRPIDFDRYLGLAGLRARVTWAPARDRDGRPAPDLRVWGWSPEGGGGLLIRLTDPDGAWGRAGLRTGDELVSVGGAEVRDWPAMRRALSALRVGDTARVVVRRGGVARELAVAVTGYDVPSARVEELPGATARQRATRAAWVAGAP